MDWRSWTAADRAAVTYRLLVRQYRDDTAQLRDLYTLVGDRDALAALDREIMGQASTVQTDF